MVWSGRPEFAGTERFEITRRVGEGGMGVVYEAYDNVADRSVALKTLTAVDANGIYRMKQEFRALTDVSHPNLVTLYELFSHGEQWFFTMELIQGVDFLEHVAQMPSYSVTDGLAATLVRRTRDTEVSERWTERRAGRFSREEEITEETDVEDLEREDDEPEDPQAEAYRTVAEVDLERVRRGLRQLAEGTFALHQAGKLHRDIKPSNVLVTEDGRVVLLDFGLATELYEEQLVRSTVQGAVCGTLVYMSPEQGSGMPLSPASDWYSVGVVLFEALTGRVPFDGKMFKILVDKQRLDAPAPRDLVPDAPEDLNDLCVALLQRDPQKRPSGLEILERLGVRADVASDPNWRVPSSMPPFIGREMQLEKLMRAYETTKDGKASTAYIRGRSGIGKSALIRHFVDEFVARDAALVLGGRCYERELVPYKALDTFIDSLSRHLRRLSDDEVKRLISPEIAHLARIFPVLDRVELIGALSKDQATASSPLELRDKAFWSLRLLLDEITRDRHVVIVLDDLQWGDADSGHLLASLMRPPRPPPLLLIASFRREGEEHSPLLEVMRSSLAFHNPREMAIEQVEVGPLLSEEAMDLALSVLVHRRRKRARSNDSKPTVPTEADSLQGRARAVALESGGNPLFVYELAGYTSKNEPDREPLRGMEAEVTPVREIRLDHVLHERFRSLPFAARRLLEVISIAARPIVYGLAKRAAGLDTDDTKASSVLEMHRFIRTQIVVGKETVEVSHDRIRETIVANLSPDVVHAHHLALARELEKSQEPDQEALVYHLRGAGEVRRAGDYALQAAMVAFDGLAFDRAATLYGLCVDLAPHMTSLRWDLNRRLADSLSNAGYGPEAASAYLTAASEAPGNQSVELQRRAAQEFLRAGYLDRGLAVLREVLARVGLRFPKSSRSASRAVTMLHAALRIRGFGYSLRPESEIAVIDLQRVDVCWSVTTGLALADPVRALYFAQKGLSLALAAGEPYRLVRALAAEVVFLGGLDRKGDRMDKALSVLESVAAKVDRPHVRGLVLFARGFAAEMHGSWLEAEHFLDRSIQVHTEHCPGTSWEVDTARYIALECVASRGAISGLPERVYAYLADAESRKNVSLINVLNTSPSVTLLSIALDDVESGRRGARDALARRGEEDYLLEHQYALVSRTNFDLYEGRRLEAWKRVEREWPRLEESGLMRLTLVRFSSLDARARATLAALSESPQQDDLFVSVETVIRGIEALRLQWGGALVALYRGQMAVLKGDRIAAAECFEDAEHGFNIVDMQLHAASARRRRGELVGGADGRELVKGADDFMTSQSIRDPKRFATVFVPVGVG